LNLNPSYASRKEFDRAHYQAVVEDLLARFRGEPADLLPFEEVRQRLNLTSRSYRGVQTVLLTQIVGSVDRYRDFNRNFLPRRLEMRQRWVNVDRLVADGSMPAIELYKVGDAYFVLDGNHRVSVARRAGIEFVEAHVWEYTTRVPLEPDTKIDDLVLKQERLEFLERTCLDRNCPEQHIQFTRPGGYRELEYQIALYQDVLSQIDERPFSYQEAAVLWYDMLYTSVVQIIEMRNVLKDFPGRTEADLFVWLVRNQRELSEVYSYEVPMSEATDFVVDRYGAKWPRRFWVALKERLKG